VNARASQWGRAVNFGFREISDLAVRPDQRSAAFVLADDWIPACAGMSGNHA